MKYKLLLLTTVILMAIHGSAQTDQLSIDSVVQKSVENDLFEGTILIAQNGDIDYHRSFGFTDNEKNVPITNQSLFGIASITKLFTAIVIMELIEEGKFQLSDHLESLLPEYKIQKSKQITIHHLLLHISGLPNEKDEIYANAKSPAGFVTETLSSKGSRIGSFNYANIDYALLGLIVEKYDNKSWQESVQQRILDNLGMSNTGFLELNKYPEDFAYSYTYDTDGKRQADPLFHIENYYAAGSMYSTATDLLKLDQAMYDSRLLSETSKELMYTSYPEYNYSGYSVWTYNYPFAESKPKIMERRGGILGANSVLMRILDTNKTIIILSNNNKFDPDSFGNIESLKEALIIEVNKTN